MWFQTEKHASVSPKDDDSIMAKKQQESYKNKKICYIYKEKFENKYLKDKKYHKAWDHFYYTGEHRGAEHSTYNLKYSVPRKII